MFIIFISIAFIMIFYVGIKAYINHSKKRNLSTLEQSKAAIVNLYVFLAALTIMLLVLAFQDGRVDSNDALFLFQFLVIAGFFGAVIVKEKNKSK